MNRRRRGKTERFTEGKRNKKSESHQSPCLEEGHRSGTRRGRRREERHGAEETHLRRTRGSKKDTERPTSTLLAYGGQERPKPETAAQPERLHPGNRGNDNMAAPLVKALENYIYSQYDSISLWRNKIPWLNTKLLLKYLKYTLFYTIMQTESDGL